MRKLIVEEWLSLDGFAAEKDGGLGFFPSTEADKYSDRDQLRFLDRVDTMLLGRVTYGLFAGFWPTAASDQEIIADRLNGLDKVVCLNTLAEAPWGEVGRWPVARVLRGDAVEGVRALKALPGKDIVLWGSLSLAQALMGAGLIDEYHVQVCLILLGGGRAFFPAADRRASLKLVETRKYDTGVVYLSYVPEGG